MYGGRRHTSYLSFLLHGQDFWVIFCSTQKCVNCKKMISRQKSVNHFKTANILNLSRTAKFGTRSNLSLIHITKLLHRTNNFVLWGKIACHVMRFCSTRPSKISMWSKIAPHEICCSTDNVRSVRDKYDVWCTICALCTGDTQWCFTAPQW